MRHLPGRGKIDDRDEVLARYQRGVVGLIIWLVSMLSIEKGRGPKPTVISR